MCAVWLTCCRSPTHPHQELRSALQSFKAVAGARGARLVAFAPSFGEAGANATLQYYLASCADKVCEGGERDCNQNTAVDVWQ
jgi:hypothetical protein